MADLTAEERLERRKADFPLRIAGCQVVQEPATREGGRPVGMVYDIRSGELLAAEHRTRFRSRGNAAEITGIANSGPFVGYEDQSAPIDKHVQVLRDGFTEMILPDGRRYEIHTPPGVRRTRN